MKLLATFAAQFLKLIGPDLVKWIVGYFNGLYREFKQKKIDIKKRKANVEDIKDAQKSKDRKAALKRAIDITKRR